MVLIRIRDVQPLGGAVVRLVLSDGTTVERDLSALLTGPVFESVRADEASFRCVRVEAGTLVWPDGADLCPDTVIWGGLPPESGARPPATMVVGAQVSVRATAA